MPGFDNDVVFAGNVDFRGVKPRQATMISNGQLLIGSTALNAGGTHINVGSLSSPDSSLTIGYSSPNITLQVAGGTTVGKTITGDSGGALAPSAGNWNLLGSGSITTSGSGSTLTTQLTGLTNHNILVGAGTTTITKVAPSATSGVPLISQGASADPVFGTAVVAGGGTGVASFTAYTPICGGTTTTGALQSVASIGTSGQVLTSNGAAALPTFQTIASPSNSNAILQLSEDFVGARGGGSYAANYSWYAGAAIALVGSGTLADSGHPGVIENSSLGAGAFFGAALLGDNITQYATITLGGGTLVINWVFNIRALSTVTNRYILNFGLGDTVAASDQANGCYIEYSDNVNSGNWTFKTAKASVRTTSNSSIAASTGWHNCQITVNAAASSVSFLMDGVSMGTAIATNIPTAAVSPMYNIYRTAGTIAANTLSVDLMYLTQTLTTPR